MPVSMGMYQWLPILMQGWLPDCLVKGSIWVRLSPHLTPLHVAVLELPFAGQRSGWVRLSPQLFGLLAGCSPRAVGLLLWIAGCSLSLLLLLLVCVAAGDDFQPGLGSNVLLASCSRAATLLQPLLMPETVAGFLGLQVA